MKRASAVILALLFSLLAGMAVAQQDDGEAMAQVMESERFGPYLTDSEGRTLYLFVDEEMEGQGPARMTEGVREAAVSCTGECLDAWPAFTSEDDVEAGEQLDPELLYTAEFDGRTHVVYNGWPLFYFVQDDEPGEINGQAIESFGGEWFVLNPQGQVVRSEQQPAAEGEDDGDVAGGGQADEGQDDPVEDEEAADDDGEQDDAQDGAQDGAGEGEDDRY